MSIIDVLGIVGGLVLFLYGIQTLGEGLKKVSGGKMESILQNLTSNKWKAALLGTLVTAVIQSSGATIVMVVGFVNSQIMTLEQSVGVILGANIGTTVTAWLLSTTGIQSDNLFLQLLRPANFSPIIGILGVFMLMMGKKQRVRDVGGIMTSFAVLMIGMNAMSTAASPLADDPSFTGLLTAFSNPILGLCVGLVVTVILQSSSASIGILQAISLTGTLKMGSAIPVLMGENIGSAITGILGSIGASRNARRAALIQLFYCIVKTTVFMAVFYPLNAVLHFAIMGETATPVSIAVFHSVFNIIAVLVVLPISDFLVKLVRRAVPVTEQEREEAEGKKALQILDPKYVASPSFALEQCRKATNAMAEHAQEAVRLATGLVLSYDEEAAAKVDKIERRVDEYEDQLNSYLVQIMGMNFTPAESHLLTLLYHSIGDYERMTDHALNVMQASQAMHQKGTAFSSRARDELSVYGRAVNDIVGMTVTGYEKLDTGTAAQVEPLESVIDGLSLGVRRRHARRVRKGKCSVELGIVLEDITTDFERIGDHCTNISVFLSQLGEDDLEFHDYLEHLESEGKLTELRTKARELEQVYALPPLKEETGSEEKEKEKPKKKKDDKKKDDKNDRKGAGRK
ncbi:MAG: Na/Pi cotransporter family protein [Firmicutes bacterium]|jgi:phosphate:Na+ symporter|nr:Na/Pi cotransporter family protein [Bacillota bacterium]